MFRTASFTINETGLNEMLSKGNLITWGTFIQQSIMQSLESNPQSLIPIQMTLVCIMLSKKKKFNLKSATCQETIIQNLEKVKTTLKK